MTPRILGIVTDEHARFTCRKCGIDVEMVRVIDIRQPRARVWREASAHPCDTKKPSSETKPIPHEAN